MTAALGHAALQFAFVAALLLGTLPLFGLARGRPRCVRSAAPLALAHALLVALAFGCLVVAFVRQDYSLLYVVLHSSQELPLPYRVAAVWGGHEGSMLLWLLVLAGWTVALARFGRGLPEPLRVRALAVLGWVSAALLLFTITTSTPFVRLALPAPAGNDLNPILQHPAMALHPPLLYLGYVGFAVPFALAVAVLWEGQLETTWARAARPWTAMAWAFLTLGILLGSVWAYDVLGWGGWWFWDPVENASFMPWLVGTALIHSLAATEKRGVFRSWTVLLALLAFLMSLLGTFLVRSGVLSSVHAFASDPQRGLSILLLLGAVVGGSLALYAWRAPRLGSDVRFELVSRESMLLAHNLIFVAALLAVMLGTLYPLLLDALGRGRISVGAPYFDSVFLPLTLPMALLLGIGPLTAWKQEALKKLARQMRRPALAVLVAVPVAVWSSGPLSPASLVGLCMSFWIAAGISADLCKRLRTTQANARHRGGRLPRSFVGMLLAHAGVAVFAFAVSQARSGEQDRLLQMSPGDRVAFSGHEIVFHGTVPIQGPTYEAMQAQIDVMRHGRLVAQLRPEKRVYRARGQAVGEPAIGRGLTHDVHAVLGEPIPGTAGAWSLRLHRKPFVTWIWGGALLMTLGGAVAASDRRYRSRQAADALQPAVPPTPAQAAEATS